MICAEQNKKISFLTTYNPFSNRAIFSFIPVLACWYMAIHYHAMYQTCDDMDMRILLEGSIGGSISEPSEFTLYMNVLYGKILKFFYTVYRNGYWYDIFTYLFASVSLFVLAMSVCKDFERESLFSIHHDVRATGDVWCTLFLHVGERILHGEEGAVCLCSLLCHCATFFITHPF